MRPPATLSVYRHGVSGGIPGAGGSPGLRRESRGWSVASSRANTRFLQSVREHELSGCGLSLSLTVRDCPETHSEWKRARLAFFERLRRRGAVRVHWLTEWQARGVPHLHAAIWFPESMREQAENGRLQVDVLAAWSAIAGPRFGASLRAQHVEPIWGVIGWLKYLSKHGARGQQHYQRAAQGIPPGWERTGRMWGHWGEWSLEEPYQLSLSRLAWFRFRRLLRGYRRAEARSAGRWRGLRAARRMLRCPFREASELRGVGGWVPGAIAQALADAATTGAEDGQEEDGELDPIWG